MRWTQCIGALALAACTFWALRTPSAGSSPSPSWKGRATSTTTSSAPADHLDIQLFASVNLWHVPVLPPVQKPTPPAEPPKPLKVELIGIVHDAGVNRAALYDADADRLFIVSIGDGLREYRVTSVTELDIELSDGHSARRLTLKREPS